MVDELHADFDTLGTEQEHLQNELDALVLERQWVITQARRGGISEIDMDYQLGALTLQESNLKRELGSIGQAVNIHLSSDWEEKVQEYLVDLQAGLESLNAAPLNKEERQEIFELKKQIVNTLVKRVTIDHNRVLQVEISLNLLSLLDDESTSNNPGGQSKRGQIQLDGTYTRKRSVLARRHRCAFCGLPFRRACRSQPQRCPRR